MQKEASRGRHTGAATKTSHSSGNRLKKNSAFNDHSERKLPTTVLQAVSYAPLTYAHCKMVHTERNLQPPHFLIQGGVASQKLPICHLRLVMREGATHYQVRRLLVISPILLPARSRRGRQQAVRVGFGAEQAQGRGAAAFFGLVQRLCHLLFNGGVVQQQLGDDLVLGNLGGWVGAGGEAFGGY